MRNVRTPPRKQYRRTFIREWRKFRGLTLEQLAERIGMKASTLSYLERGQSAYTQGTLESLALALNVEVASLLTVDPGKEGDVVDLVRIIREKKLDEQAKRILRALADDAS